MIPSFKEAIHFWFRLGWSNFGGPAGQISLMHKMLVEEKKWISEDEFSHALNYCMFLPGPEAQQLARPTWVGFYTEPKEEFLQAYFLFFPPF
ncbi:chromate transport domain protein [Leptospira borgpetersenii serovar Hardjo-bovis str. Sponselee]|uniref:Chromate transport domain protein n=1 Tax=Leptospira borgpetersenii serovar Hardjo-bovis str. Sponselee TaxID=1303729 RepID=M6BUR7_LEPBO|nr:chromate transport domain protein [Leptospira borgpetersenii serovar Hardjo-bovis str. Sponselee]